MHSFDYSGSKRKWYVIPPARQVPVAAVTAGMSAVTLSEIRGTPQCNAHVGASMAALSQTLQQISSFAYWRPEAKITWWQHPRDSIQALLRKQHAWGVFWIGGLWRSTQISWRSKLLEDQSIRQTRPPRAVVGGLCHSAPPAAFNADCMPHLKQSIHKFCTMSAPARH